MPKRTPQWVKRLPQPPQDSQGRQEVGLDRRLGYRGSEAGDVEQALSSSEEESVRAQKKSEKTF